MNTKSDAATQRKDSRQPKAKHHSLVGMWFHSHDDNGSLRWQGQIVGQSNGLILVQLYEWGFGYPSEKRAVHEAEVTEWSLYSTNAKMREAGNNYLATQYC